MWYTTAKMWKWLVDGGVNPEGKPILRAFLPKRDIKWWSLLFLKFIWLKISWMELSLFYSGWTENSIDYNYYDYYDHDYYYYYYYYYHHHYHHHYQYQHKELNLRDTIFWHTQHPHVPSDCVTIPTFCQELKLTECLSNLTVICWIFSTSIAVLGFT